MKRKIYVEHIHSTDARLKRHINHDSESKRYAYKTDKLTLVSATHQRHIPFLDQGQVGSCTGNAGIGNLGTDPFYPPVAHYPLTEAGALQLYSDAELLDGDGPYPPNDNGSSGLSIAKVLKKLGIISGYQHTFTLNDALLALTKTPVLVGVNWYQGMFTPDKDGRVHIKGALAGGHEICARQIDVENQRVWFDNSWGVTWGVQGRFYLPFEDFGKLLAQKGDVTILIPNTQPAPQPSPVPAADPDKVLATAMRQWLTDKNI